MRLSNRTRFASIAATLLMAGIGLAGTATGASAQPAPNTSVAPRVGVFNPIKNVGDSECLQPIGGSTALFAAIVQEPCNGSAAQGWQFLKVATNHYHFLNQNSGLCFDAFDGVFNGARLLQNTCANISNDEWNTGATLPDVVKLESRVGFRDTGFCIDVPGGAATNGAAMQIFGCNGTLAQRWVVGFS